LPLDPRPYAVAGGTLPDPLSHCSGGSCTTPSPQYPASVQSALQPPYAPVFFAVPRSHFSGGLWIFASPQYGPSVQSELQPL
jgi:hypothetical protein